MRSKLGGGGGGAQKDQESVLNLLPPVVGATIVHKLGGGFVIFLAQDLPGRLDEYNGKPPPPPGAGMATPITSADPAAQSMPSSQKLHSLSGSRRLCLHHVEFEESQLRMTGATQSSCT